jgi:periplasmic protein TonB
MLPLAALACATAPAPSRLGGNHPLDYIDFHQDIGTEWRLRSIAAVEVSERPSGPCPGRENYPVRVDLVYQRPANPLRSSLEIFTCVATYSRTRVGVHESPGHQIVPGPRPGAQPAEADPRPAASASDSGNPRLVEKVLPDIPAGMRSSGERTRYFATVCIDLAGNVTTVRLRTAKHHPQIDARMIDALSRWKFEPARFNGHAVPSCPALALDV